MKLKKIRVGLAAVVFVISLGLFVTGIESLQLITKLQVIPAVIGNNLLIILGIGIGTILLGRVYCSVICPLGILQDLIISYRKKSGFKFNYQPTSWMLKIIKGVILAVTAASFILGANLVINIIDPYSNFGRIMINLVRPLAIIINNLIAAVVNFFNIYLITNLQFSTVETLGFLLVVGYFLLLVVLSFYRGRFYCTRLCPVGLILGFLARFSLFKVQINGDCIDCGACESICKSSCLNSEQREIDYNRCVTCFDCQEVCPEKAVEYKIAINKQENSKAVTSSSKRAMLGELASVTGGVAVGWLGKYGRLLSTEEIKDKKQDPVLPPGARSRSRFHSLCTACHLCIAACPTQIIKPALVDYGINGWLQPKLDYSRGFCDYECNLCSQICPVNALEPLTLEEKKRTQLGVVQFFKDKCIVYNKDKACGACAEHCSTKAIHQVKYKPEKNLRAPEVNQEICIGCGACENVCPERGKALYVDGNHQHKRAQPPGIRGEETEKTKENFDDFGF